MAGTVLPRHAHFVADLFRSSRLGESRAGAVWAPRSADAASSSALEFGQGGRDVDDAEMREGLQEVAEKPSRRRIVFLGEEAEVVAQIRQALEQRDRVGATVLARA